MYKIYGIIINVEPLSKQLDELLISYYISRNLESSCDVISVKTMTSNFDEIVNGETLFSNKKVLWQSYSNFEIIYYKKTNYISHAIKYSKDWKNVELLIKDSMFFEQEYYLYGVIFAFIALRHNGINLHGSAISYKDQGIIFSGPSGAGKSTQSHLWQSVFNQDVDILNDDKPIIDMNKDVPDVYGTPFAGSSKLNTNKHMPLKAIVIIEKAPYNKVVKTKRSEAYLHLLRESTRPEYSKSEMEHFLNLLEDLLNKIPIYTLYCTKEEDAVYTLHKTLFEGDQSE